jgi:hypothetical protein
MRVYLISCPDGQEKAVRAAMRAVPDVRGDSVEPFHFNGRRFLRFAYRGDVPRGPEVVGMIRLNVFAAGQLKLRMSNEEM